MSVKNQALEDISEYIEHFVEQINIRQTHEELIYKPTGRLCSLMGIGNVFWTSKISRGGLSVRIELVGHESKALQMVMYSIRTRNENLWFN